MVAANPAIAGIPVVVIANRSDAPETGYAALKFAEPCVKPKMSPSPAARNTIDAIKLRSEFMGCTAFRPARKFTPAVKVAQLCRMDRDTGSPALGSRPSNLSLFSLSETSDCEPSFLTQPGDVPGGRASEEPAVLSAELRSAQIPHVLTRSARIHHG